MVQDDACMFGGEQGDHYAAAGSGDGVGAKRRKLLKGDYIAAVLFENTRPGVLEQSKIDKLWEMVAGGSKYADYHSYLASDEAERRGTALSQFAEALRCSIEHLRQERVQVLLKPEVASKINAVADALYPHFKVLDGGPAPVAYGKKRLVEDQRAHKSPEEVATSAGAIYDWLMRKECPFRSYLARVGGSGVNYAAQAQEKTARAYVHHGTSRGKDGMVMDAKARLCQADGASGASESQDDYRF